MKNIKNLNRFGFRCAGDVNDENIRILIRKNRKFFHMKYLKYTMAFLGIFFFGAVLSLRAYSINGPSMSPTVWWGERVIANHLSYLLEDPAAGDMIIYFDTHKNSVACKRIVAIPGDQVWMQNNVLFVNGMEQKHRLLERWTEDMRAGKEVLGEMVATEETGSITHYLTYTRKKSEKHSFDPIKLQADEYFILGDHRDNSMDSRFIGPIAKDQIQGEVIWW